MLRRVTKITVPKFKLANSLVASRLEPWSTLAPSFESQGKHFSTASKETPATSSSAKKGFLERLIGVESNVASENFKSRWLMLLPAIACHLSIGSPYAWSVVADILTREVGFVLPAAADWSLMEAALPLSIVFVGQGVTGALFGNWQLKVGPRKAMTAAACAFGGGLLVGSLGVYLHSLPLLYTGYGALAGMGVGLAYTPPLQTLMQWFPDKKGVASGICIAGFGSGALLFAPCVQYLTKMFAKMPTYLGPARDFVTQTIDGKLFATVDGSLVEVVNATSAELSKIVYSLPEGLYVVGSGSSGAAEALAVMGLAYFTTMMAGALTIRKPHPSFTVEGSAPAANSANAVAAPPAVPDVPVEQAMRSPQFYLLGATFWCVACGGLGLFSVAKPMMSEIFSSALPAVVTSAFASSFVLMLSSGNLGGRLGWAYISDKIGRRKTFQLITLGSIPLYLSIPTLVDSVITSGSAAPLYAFCAVTTTAICGMGGVYAVLPAYEADIFGTKFVGAIHGRMLLFSSLASIAGPFMLMKLRSISEKAAIDDLLTKVDPQQFISTFGAPMEKAADLMATKTLTISKLLALTPPGTLDPTPHLYDSTMYALTGLMATSVLIHSLVRRSPAAPATITVQAKESKVIEVPQKEEPAGDRRVN
eukprot:gene2119-2313_t